MSGRATAVCAGACGQVNVTTGCVTGASGNAIAHSSVSTAEARRSPGPCLTSRGGVVSAEVLTPRVLLGRQRREPLEAAAGDLVDAEVVAVGRVVVDDSLDRAPRQRGHPAVGDRGERA